nr:MULTISPECIES: acyltransferase family protein [unclassified Pseudomonas]
MWRGLVKNRDLSVDVLRGLGILLVVSGHASSGATMVAFAPYSFHMPLFFFVSGLFFSEYKVDGVISTITKNVRALLLYSTAFYLFYAVVCWVISRIGFDAFAQPFSLELLIGNQFTTGGAYKFTSAYWFIPCLFFVKVYFSVIHSRLAVLFEGFGEKVVSIVFFCLYLLLAFLAVIYSMKMYAENYAPLDKIVLYRFMFAMFFYYLGSVVARYNIQRFFSNVLVLAAIYVVQQQLLVFSGNLDFWMQVSKYQANYLPVFGSVLGIAFFYGIAQIVSSNKSFAKILGYIGENSFPILLHHLFGFFVLNVLLCVFGVIKPSAVTSQYYQLDTVHSWPFYIVAAVLYSLAFDRYIVVPIKMFIKRRIFGASEKVPA